MPDTIRDGKGNGNLAEVDADNHLHTVGIVVDRLGWNSQSKGKAYSIYGRRNFAAGSTDEGILYFSYTGTNKFIVDKIIVAGNGANNKVEIFVDSTYSSGGTDVTPINFNRSTANTLSATAKNGSTTLTVTKGDSEVIDVRFGIDTVEVDMRNSLVLNNGKNVYLLGEVANAGEKIRAMILGYEEETDL